MRTEHKKTGFPSVWGLLVVALLAACGSDNSDGKMVAVNLSLIVDGRQANNQTPVSRLFALMERWFPLVAPAWAQSVTDIASLQVQITGPGIPVPASTTVSVSNPTSGQEIPVSIQAPAGPNRTIAVSAFNGANHKIFSGTLPGVNLTAGAPIDLQIVLKRLFTVTVEKRGSGTGTIISTPPGIDCGPTCSTQAAQFEEGTIVSLTPPAAAGSAFAGWGGDCSGVGDCTLSGAATVTARFNVPASTNHLHVDIGGTGAGTVRSQPSGISCPPSCDADFETNATVRLTADAANGSTFSNWSGAGCSGGAPSCTVVMNTDQSVTAVFTAIVQVPMSTLTVQKNGSGNGTVTSAPSGINCGGTCSAQFPTDNTVTLTANPAPGSTFVGWSGACAGASCTVTMETDKTVSAQFDLLPALVTLSINKSGNGDGTVTSDPPGIDCGGTCQATYTLGTTVTLTAVPDGRSIFGGWRTPRSQSPCNDQTDPCVLTMDDNRSVTARFVEP